MLTDTKLRGLKAQVKLYKVNDRHGLYVTFTTAGSISFRYNYSISGRQETISFGRCGVGGISLAEAREQLGEAKKDCCREISCQGEGPEQGPSERRRDLRCLGRKVVAQLPDGRLHP